MKGCEASPLGASAGEVLRVEGLMSPASGGLLWGGLSASPSGPGGVPGLFSPAAADTPHLLWEGGVSGTNRRCESPPGAFPSIFDLPELEGADLTPMDSLTLEKAAQIVAYAEGLRPDGMTSPTVSLLRDERFSDLWAGGGEVEDATTPKFPFSFSSSDTQSADSDFPLMYIPPAGLSVAGYSSMDTSPVGFKKLNVGPAPPTLLPPGAEVAGAAPTQHPPESPEQVLEQKAAAVVAAIERAPLSKEYKAKARSELQSSVDDFLAKRQELLDKLKTAAGKAAAANPRGVKSFPQPALLAPFEASFDAALDRARVRVEGLVRPPQRAANKQTEILKKWLYEHFDSPFPSDQEKLDLAELVGCSRRQVQNWFINARVRHWRPMVWRLAARIEATEGTGVAAGRAPEQRTEESESSEGHLGFRCEDMQE